MMIFIRLLAGVVIVLSALQLGVLQAGGHLSGDNQFLFVMSTGIWALTAIIMSAVRK